MMKIFSFLCVLALAGAALGHGYVSRPIARQVYCRNYAGNFYWPENGSGITNLMCKTAFYHVASRWDNYDFARQQFIQINEFANMYGEQVHQLMPDNLCGAGAGNATLPFGDKSGMSEPGRWVTTAVANSTEFEWCITANHVGGYLEYYVTKPGVDITTTHLRWEHFTLLERVENTVLVIDSSTTDCPNGQYFRNTVDLPSRAFGERYVVLARWQRRVSADGSTEGFYNCIDLKSK